MKIILLFCLCSLTLTLSVAQDSLSAILENPTIRELLRDTALEDAITRKLRDPATQEIFDQRRAMMKEILADTRIQELIRDPKVQEFVRDRISSMGNGNPQSFSALFRDPKFLDLMDDPRVEALMNDRKLQGTIRRGMMSGGFGGGMQRGEMRNIMKNPKVRELMQDLKVQELIMEKFIALGEGDMPSIESDLNDPRVIELLEDPRVKDLLNDPQIVDFVNKKLSRNANPSRGSGRTAVFDRIAGGGREIQGMVNRVFRPQGGRRIRPTNDE